VTKKCMTFYERAAQVNVSNHTSATPLHQPARP
jgi:hypothetical protein